MIRERILEKKMETCAFCRKEFDINKRDNSGYIDHKPICAPCREDYRDYLSYNQLMASNRIAYK